MKITWSPLAAADRQNIFDYIEAENPRAAAAIDTRIANRVRHLRQFPTSGRSGRVAGTRELVISGTPYIAIYEVTDTECLILRLLHSAQNWPNLG